MVTQAFLLAVLRYRAGGGKMYRLAIDHGMSPSLLSATITGARRVPYDERLVKIGAALGLRSDEIFEDSDQAVSS